MNGRATILLVEDEVALREGICFQLERAEYSVVAVESGEAALESVKTSPPDLILLDINLPGIDGLEVCQKLRASEYHLPVLLLTARGDEIDRVVGLEVGADDYIVKPFSSRELLARIKAHLRRERRRGEPSVEPLPTPEAPAPVTLDPLQREARRDGELLDLTPREFDLLNVLIAHKGQVLTREQLLEKVWGYDFEGESRVVNVTIGRLRDKLENDPSNPRHLLTVRGVGYRFVL